MKTILRRGLALLLCFILCLSFIPSALAEEGVVEELIQEEALPDWAAEEVEPENGDTAGLYPENTEQLYKAEGQLAPAGSEELRIEEPAPETETEQNALVLSGEETTQSEETPTFDVARVEEALNRMNAAWSEAASAAIAEPRRGEPETVRASNKAAQRGVSPVERLDSSLCIVRFYSEKGYDLVGLSVTDAAGKALEPASTDDGWTYLLDPGAYTYRYHDDRNIFTDVGETAFTVDGDQEIPITLTAVFADRLVFSWDVNPLYEDYADETASEYTYEDALDDMIEYKLAESENGGRKRSRSRGFPDQAAQLRNGMAAQMDEIPIDFTSDSQWTEEDMNNTYTRVLKEAVQHTGNHWEGDTLSFGYYKFGKVWDPVDPDETTGIYTYTIIFKFIYRKTAPQEQLAFNAVESMAAALEGLSELEKAYAINQWLYLNVDYDYAHEKDKEYHQQYSDYGALIQKIAVCQGFAISYYRIALASGLDARVTTSSEMRHAWNIVKVGDVYYELDATWDSNRRENNTSPLSDLPVFFLRGSTWWLNPDNAYSDHTTIGDQFDSDSPKYDESFNAYTVSSEDGLYYTVSYNKNGGDTAPVKQAKGQGTALTLTSEEPTRANPQDEIYTVTLVANGGKIITSSGTLAARVVYSPKKTVTYSFLRWNTQKNGSGTNYESGALYTENANIELFALWKKTTRTQFITLPTPIWEGHVFMGWGTSSDATTGITGTYTPTEPVTFYAVWIEPDFILPAALTTIEEEAFMGGAFTFAKLSDNTASIGARAFADCPNLAYILMPSGVTVDPTAIPENVSIFYSDAGN